jgi:hypothetical protein
MPPSPRLPVVASRLAAMLLSALALMGPLAAAAAESATDPAALPALPTSAGYDAPEPIASPLPKLTTPWSLGVKVEEVPVPPPPKGHAVDDAAEERAGATMERYSLVARNAQGALVHVAFAHPDQGLVEKDPAFCYRAEGSGGRCWRATAGLHVIAGPIDLDGDGGPEWIVRRDTGQWSPPIYFHEDALVSLRPRKDGLPPRFAFLSFTDRVDALTLADNKPAVVDDLAPGIRLAVTFDGTKLRERRVVHPAIVAARKARPLPSARPCPPTPDDASNDLQCITHDLGGDATSERVVFRNYAPRLFSLSVFSGEKEVFSHPFVPLSHPPKRGMFVLPTKTNGWHDLYIADLDPSFDVVLQWTGQQYDFVRFDP